MKCKDHYLLSIAAITFDYYKYFVVIDFKLKIMKNKNLNYLILLLLVLLLSSRAGLLSQNAGTNNEVLKISSEIFVINSTGCNIAVIVGQEGLLVIDSGDERSALKTDSLISTISGLPIKYILNTHLHFDHLGGNKILSEKGATIIAQNNTRESMLKEWDVPEIAGMKFPVIPPYPKEYLPKICFQDSLSIYFDSNVIKSISLPGGHSSSDVIYYFPEANIIHTGDLYLSNGFPIIDLAPGSIDAYINAVDNIIHICDDNTVIIPGHGPLSNLHNLKEYRSMLMESRNRIEKLIRDGKTLDEVIAENPTRDLYKGGKSTIPDKLFVATVYICLSQK